MSRTNDRLIRQGQNFLAVVSERVFVGDVAATHRAGKERVADDCNRPSKAGNDVGYPAGRMTGGQARFDFQGAGFKMFSFRDRLRAFLRFELRNVNRRIGRLPEPPQIGDVIGMGVRQQNQSDAELFLIDAPQHLTAIGAGVERHRVARRRIPDEVRVHRYVVIRRVELGEPGDFFHRFPFSRGQLAKTRATQFQDRRDAIDRVRIEISGAQASDFVRRDPGSLGQLAIGDAQATLRLSDDVGNVIF
jgi:hypothetical protein